MVENFSSSPESAVEGLTSPEQIDTNTYLDRLADNATPEVVLEHDALDTAAITKEALDEATPAKTLERQYSTQEIIAISRWDARAIEWNREQELNPEPQYAQPSQAVEYGFRAA